MLTIITGWSPKGWNEYGKNFIASFIKYWPKGTKLVVYTEDNQLIEGAEVRNVLEVPGCYDFIKRWGGDRAAIGRAPSASWKRACVMKGYNFRFDAVKFCRQGFIPYDAALKLDGGDLLCWLDGDVVTTAPVPEGFIESLLPPNKAVAYLGRGDKFSEIGFQLYRVPQAIEMLREFSDTYSSNEVFKLREWHSAYIFDRARSITETSGHDLTPGGRGHVWKTSVLDRYMTHLKGERKYDFAGVA